MPFKAFIRGYLTSAFNAIKKTTTKVVEDLEAAEVEYLLNPNDHTWTSWHQTQTKVKEAHVEAAHRQVFFWCPKCF